MNTRRQQSEQQAAYEATLIAAPDMGLSAPSSDYHMASERNQSIVAGNDTGKSHPQLENAIETILDPLAEDLARNQPSITAGQNHLSISSISQLHIPGEFPRGSSYSA